ncbi:hypothetical protein ACI65C_006720 [Semiaphis heraclei]
MGWGEWWLDKRTALVRPRLKPNSVPFSARKRLKFSENKVVEDLIQPCNALATTSTANKTTITSGSDEEELISMPITNIESLPKDIMSSPRRVMLEHNYSISFDDDTSLIGCNNSDFNIPVHQKNKLNQTSKLPFDTDSILFEELNTWDLNLPSHWQKYSSIDKKFFGVSEIVFAQKQNNLNSFMQKTIIVNQNLKLTCNILGKNISKDKFTNSFHKLESHQHLVDLINELASMKICRGVDLFEKKSSVSTPKRLIKKTTPKSKKSLEILRKNNERQRNQKNRFRNKIDLMRKNMDESKEKFKSTTQYRQYSIEQKMNDINCPEYQKTIIKEIFVAAKAIISTIIPSRRYSDEWIMLCMLLHIRSPSGYNFLNKNKILPLPSISSIRRYLGSINMTCSFDSNFFALLKKYLENKTEFQKHGILLVDEISVREAITVFSKSLTYRGLVDYGKDYKATDIHEKATSGLVFMFQPLADSYSQPVAVFASRSPVAGALIHGIVSDGAQTNRKMWSELGIHGQYIQWNHIKRLYEENIKLTGNLRVCPKLSKHHIQLSISDKMRVRFATQVLSNSVANGLLFYKSYNIDGF